MQAFILLLTGIIFAFLLYLVHASLMPWYFAIITGTAIALSAAAAIYIAED